MKTIGFFVSVFAFSLMAQASSECETAETLFSNGKTYSCELLSGDPICLKVGYHDTVETDGFRLFELDENKIDQIDQMFFDDNAFLKCKFNFFNACTHQEIEISESKIKGYAYRAPDVWDSRSAERMFEYDFNKGYGEMVYKNYNSEGKLKDQSTISILSCK